MLVQRQLNGKLHKRLSSPKSWHVLFAAPPFASNIFCLNAFGVPSPSPPPPPAACLVSSAQSSSCLLSCPTIPLGSTLTHFKTCLALCKLSPFTLLLLQLLLPLAIFVLRRVLAALYLNYCNDLHWSGCCNILGIWAQLTRLRNELLHTPS